MSAAGSPIDVLREMKREAERDLKLSRDSIMQRHHERHIAALSAVEQLVEAARAVEHDSAWNAEDQQAYIDRDVLATLRAALARFDRNQQA